MELATHPLLSADLTAGTVAAFSVFGALLGMQERRLEEANARLSELSFTDSVTGLKNVRYFRIRLEEELAEARRSGQPLALALIDLDRFKDVNDRFGHPSVTGSCWPAGRPSSRVPGEARRWHGWEEEFGLLLPETDGPGGPIAAERVRGQSKAGGGRSPWALQTFPLRRHGLEQRPDHVGERRGRAPHPERLQA
jgi:hypothetical protein